MNIHEPKLTYHKGKKFDIQLSEALIEERRLGEIFLHSRIGRVELKVERWLWERTGNICIEYWNRGKPSGIATTQADYWVHGLKRNDALLCYFMFPVANLRDIVRSKIITGVDVKFGGDDGASRTVVIRLSDLLGR